MPRQLIAPCGYPWMAPQIQRTYRFLFPDIVVSCACNDCYQTWTERYAFDFSVPRGGMTDQQAERPYGIPS